MNCHSLANQCAMQTPNSNTTPLPLFFLQIAPVFATRSGSEAQRKDSHCSLVTFVLLLSGSPYFRGFEAEMQFGQQHSPALRAKYTPESCWACRSPNSHLQHHDMWNTRSSIAHFLEAVCLRTWVKLLFLPQRAELAFLPSRVWYSCEVPNHFWRDIGDLVPGPYSQITIITISRRTRVLPSWLQPSAPHELALQW